MRLLRAALQHVARHVALEEDAHEPHPLVARDGAAKAELAVDAVKRLLRELGRALDVAYAFLGM